MAGEVRDVYGIEKFDGRDFGFWRMQIEDYLYSKKLHRPLLDVKPTGMSEEDWKLLDRQVLGVIRLTLSKGVAHNVAKETTTRGMMEVLSDMYEKPTTNNKVHLMKKLFNLKMAESAPVAKHLNVFCDTVNQLSSVEIDFDDEVRALILLASLPNSWEPMRAAISNSIGKDKLSFNTVRDSILAEEVRRRDAGERFGDSDGTMLNVGSSGSRRGRSKSRDRRGPERQGILDWHKKAECYNCHNIGHISTFCSAPKRDWKIGQREGANVVTEGDSDDSGDVLFAGESCLENWFLDSGASFHTTSNRDSLGKYKMGKFGKVYLANGEALDVVGMGEVKIRTPNGCVWKLNKVRHVPKLKKNLISVGSLDEEGYSTSFGNGAWKVTRGSLVIGRGNRVSNLYVTGKVIGGEAIEKSRAKPGSGEDRVCSLGKKSVTFLRGDVSKETVGVTRKSSQASVTSLKGGSRVTRESTSYSPSVHYILSTISGELESPKKSRKTSIEWELAMKDEGKSTGRKSTGTWQRAVLSRTNNERRDERVFRRQAKQFGMRPRERRIGSEPKAKTIGGGPMKKKKKWVPRVHIGVEPNLIDEPKSRVTSVGTRN